ncbi:MAG TPA: hypothetical protein ENG11_04455 [candidate division Zixibacteria bacterium]|nr:hypothetical protein [candidate division Zixibacteria bacterium]
MSTETILILLVVIVAVLGAALVFLIRRLSLKAEKTVEHIDRVLDIVEQELPRFTEQSEQTLRAIEESSRTAKNTLEKLSRPLDVITSKPAWQMVSGMVSGLGAVKKLFHRRRGEQETESPRKEK